MSSKAEAVDPKPLLDAEVRCAARRAELAVKAQPKPEPQPTETELAEWKRTRSGEDVAMSNRRESLAQFFQAHDTYSFPLGGGTWISGQSCATRIRAGAPFITFYRVQGSGELRTPVRS